MPGMNGEPTKEEVAFYNKVLKSTMTLHRLRSSSPPNMQEIQKATDQLKALIASEPQNRFWTKIAGNPLKDATDLITSSGISPEINHAIQQHLAAAQNEAKAVAKESVEKNPFNHIMKSLGLKK